MERNGPENRMSGAGAGLEKCGGARAERERERSGEQAKSAAHNPLKLTID